MSKTSAIIGSSTGIGRALVELHHNLDDDCVAFSRSPESLIGVTTIELDLNDEKQAGNILDKAFSKYPDIDKIFLISGSGEAEITPDQNVAKATISLNCSGFTIAAYKAVKYLEEKGSGALIAVTSVAAIRGGSQSLSYNASKAYQSSLLEGLRCRLFKAGKSVTITEIRAGFVDTGMMKAEKPFWVASTSQAAKAIWSASKSGKSVVYVLGRWRIIAFIFKIMPIFLYKLIG